MTFNQSLTESTLFARSVSRPRGGIPLWLHLSFTIFWATAVHFIMLWRTPPSPVDSQCKRLPRHTSLLWNNICAPIWRPMQFVCSAPMFWNSDPVSFDVLGTNMVVLQGSENMSAMLKEKALSNVRLASYLVRHAFGLNKAASATHYSEQLHENDSAYSSVQKRPDTHRDLANMHHRFLTGPGGATFAKRFTQNIEERIRYIRQESGIDWFEWDDFASFFRNDLTAEVINSICGPALLDRNNDFLDDFWRFSDNLGTFVVRCPKFLAPAAYRSRDKALTALKDWQSWASRTYDGSNVDVDGDDPCWGSAFFKERYSMMLRLEHFDAEATASHELAFLYALNSNAIIATFWTALEVFRDDDLLLGIRKEVQSCTTESTAEDPLQYDISRLLKQPLLQAVYAETLRLRGHGCFVRVAQHDTRLNGWLIPKGSFTVASSTPGHMDPNIWCRSGTDAPPVDVFWPGRFLKINGDLIEFCTRDVEGSWMPYGSGWNMCPGRHFAKLQAILTVAHLVSAFDCERVGDDRVGMSMANFGIGILGPDRKVPVRMRRRAVANM